MMSSHTTPFHRPFQNIGGSNNDRPGRLLLQLLRSHDKLLAETAKKTRESSSQHSIRVRPTNAQEDYVVDNPVVYETELIELENNILMRLSFLDASIRRCGLFGNDVERAFAVHNAAKDRSSLNSISTTAIVETSCSSDGGTMKRKRKKNGGGCYGATTTNHNGSGSTGSISGSNGVGVGGGSSFSASSYGIFLDSIHSKDSTHYNNYSSLEGRGGSKTDFDDDDDEGLIITVLCKILGVRVGRRKKGMLCGEDDTTSVGEDATRSNVDGKLLYSLRIYCAALDVVSSLCDHAKYDDGTNTTTCATIEGDMIGSVGINLLDALHENISYWVTYCLHHGTEEMVLQALVRNIKACTSLMFVLESRVSRLDKIVQDVKEVASMVLYNLPLLTTTIDDGSSNARDRLFAVRDIQEATTSLLAALTLVTNVDGMPSSKVVWSECVIDATLLLRWAVHDFFPIPKFATTSNQLAGMGGTKHQNQHKYPLAWTDHIKWTSIAKDLPPHIYETKSGNINATSNHRSVAFLSRIQSLTRYIRSMLRMDGYPLHRLPNNNIPNFVIHLPLDSLIDVSEILLSFPLAAEVTHRSTKSRLRASPIVDGLLSPNAAMELSPDVRLCGHDLLNIVVESCRGGSGIQARARRLTSMALATLQSSCTSVLVSIVDGSFRSVGGDISGSIRSSRTGVWLRESIPLRIESIRTFHSIAISLGSGIMSSSRTAKSVSRALILLGGCLLEQVQGNENDTLGGSSDEWGTMGEKVKLVETSSNALAACIATFGGLIPNNIRGTIDSIIQTCFSKIYSRGHSSILMHSQVKRSILQLGMNCVCVPWQDGCRSSLSTIVRMVADMLKNDPDYSVGSVALSTLCVFDAFVTPRAPPILVTGRNSIDEIVHSETPLTASSLVARMNDAKLESLALKNGAGEGRIKKPKRKKSDIADVEVSNVDTILNRPNEKTIESRIDISRESTEKCSEKVVVETSMAPTNDMNIGGIDTFHEPPTILSKSDSWQHVELREEIVDNTDDIKDDESQNNVQYNAGNNNLISMSSMKIDPVNHDDDASEDSMDDFPAIVDQGPDDEDIILN